QGEAVTKIDSERPRWPSQFASPILSRISRSTVSASGTRSKASARHRSATPSGEDSAYSCRKASMPPLPRRSRRTVVTSARAWSAMRSRISAGSSAAARMRATASPSPIRQLARIAARRGDGGGKGAAVIISMPKILARRQQNALLAPRPFRLSDQQTDQRDIRMLSAVADALVDATDLEEAAPRVWRVLGRLEKTAIGVRRADGVIKVRRRETSGCLFY